LTALWEVFLNCLPVFALFYASKCFVKNCIEEVLENVKDSETLSKDGKNTLSP